MASRIRRDDRFGCRAIEVAGGRDRRLKELLAEALLDNKALKGLLEKTGNACRPPRRGRPGANRPGQLIEGVKFRNGEPVQDAEGKNGA